MKIGVIGGSGVYQLEDLQIIKQHNLETPFGKCSSPILEGQLNDIFFYFLPRHGVGHTLNPSEINYRANIFALKKLGVTHLLSVSAVGSLKTSCRPGTLFFPNQFIDWTKGLRRRTFFDNGMVGHVSCAHPVNLEMKRTITSICDELHIEYEIGGSYICIEGPQFSTKAESEFYRSVLGASVIGMTNVPEVFLAQEAGIAYCTIAMVTDYDCWKEEHCTVQEIIQVMKENYKQINQLLPVVLSRLTDNPPQVVRENEYALITQEKFLTKQHHEILQVILDK